MQKSRNHRSAHNATCSLLAWFVVSDTELLKAVNLHSCQQQHCIQVDLTPRCSTSLAIAAVQGPAALVFVSNNINVQNGKRV